MKDRTLIWRQRWRVWAPAVLFCALNLVFISTYRFVFAGQAKLTSKRIETRSTELAGLNADIRAVQEVLERAQDNHQAMQRLYNEWLTGEDVRLTQVIAEVKDLARRAGVEPSVINYPEEKLDQNGLVRRSLVFSVSGTYMSLRRFVNFLELTDSFLVLDEVRLSEEGDSGFGVRISLKVSTYFVEDDAEALREVSS